MILKVLFKLTNPTVFSRDNPDFTGAVCAPLEESFLCGEGPHWFTAWYRNGKLHRKDGPAYIHTETQEWYLDGKLHRTDGPARITKWGDRYYINDFLCYEKSDWLQRIREFKMQRFLNE